jgi:hypothetical protein
LLPFFFLQCVKQPTSFDTTNLLRLIDFLYSAIISLTLHEVYSSFTGDTSVNFVDGLTIVILFISTVYFIIDDWIDSRILIYRNPYPLTDFRRFAYDVIIAFLAYGALFYTSKRSSLFVVFIILSLFFIRLWANRCQLDTPETPDRAILNISQYAAVWGIFLFSVYYLLQDPPCRSFGLFTSLSLLRSCLTPQPLNLGSSFIFFALLYSWFFAHELGKAMIEPEPTAERYLGPSPPFVSHKIMRRIIEHAKKAVNK